MSELAKRVENLMLRLDRMGMRVEQSLADALQAVRNRDLEAGQHVLAGDSIIDREEVEIEQECIRLLALYQPTAIDLRTICTVIKVNSDLERIADHAASIGGRVKHVVADSLELALRPGFIELQHAACEALSMTVRMLAAADEETAHRVIEFDRKVDSAYKEFMRCILDSQGTDSCEIEGTFTLINLARALERIGDLCTNIAEDVIFLRTGDIVRHADAFEE